MGLWLLLLLHETIKMNISLPKYLENWNKYITFAA